MTLARKLKPYYICMCISLAALLISCAVGDDKTPGTITDLTSEEITRLLSWTAPGDNGNSGTVTIYFPRFYSDEQVAEILGVPNLDGVPFAEIQEAVIDNFKDATQVPDFQVPQPAGSAETFLSPRLDITGDTTYFYSIRSNDETGSSSQPSNVVELSTPLQNVRYVSSEPGSCIGQAVAAGNYDGELVTQNVCIIDDDDNFCGGGGLDTDINDIAIGDPCLGMVYIFFGQNNLTENGSTTIDVTEADVTIIGNAADSFGASLATTNDFTGDSQAQELIIGAPDFNGGTGKVYIVPGSRNIPSVIDLVNGTEDHFEIVGENPGDNFGFSVAQGSGVTNGRGVFIAGAPFYNSETGRVYVFKGGDLQKNVEVPATNAKAIFTGQQAGGMFGFDISLLGRIDNNGSDEFGVGAPGIGRAYIIFGKSNLQGKDLATDTTDVLILEGSAEDSFGTSISGDGDIDEDGFGTDDVIVGAPGTNSDTGSVFLYSGEALEANLRDGTTPVVETEFTGLNPGDLFGTSISVFPFLTPELIEEQRNTAIVLEYKVTNADFGVGAPGVPNGAVYIFFGQDNFPAEVPANQANITLTGADGDADFGSVVENLEDVNGDQQDDFSVGGAGFINVYY
jgi:hypothetical protein